MLKDNILAAIEAVLFSMGDEMPVSDLKEALGLTDEDMAAALDRLDEKYSREDCGLNLLRLEDRVQLCAKPEYFDTLIKIIQKPKSYQLTETMLETLAIIAYRQPVTRLDIEKIRGVKSDYALNQLIEYGLVREMGRMDAPGKPLLFGTTDEFLRHFGFSSLDEMPTFGREELARFRAEAVREAGEEPEEIPEPEEPEPSEADYN